RIRLDLIRQLVKKAKPDVLCLQETKVPDDLFPHQAFADMGFEHRLVHGMKGYNGVAILSRVPFSGGEPLHRCGKEDCRHLYARLPGDITTYEFTPGRALFIQKGSWLANDVTVSVDTQWGGFKNMFGSEGGFIIRTEGQGTVVFACYGALEVWNLAAGQSLTVDTGHMVAYEDSVSMTMRKASGGGLIQSFKSGEGLVFDFTGPGRVWTQTRNPTELMSWIQSFVGTSNSGTSIGGIGGGLFGRD
ncbi:MAG TPA: TIGR00266 family protein, partial [Ilumatobacteraceae bacterium]|nr:TIGR00266 family protein [Ilumatobacteraceae bacterium]